MTPTIYRPLFIATFSDILNISRYIPIISRFDGIYRPAAQKLKKIADNSPRPGFFHSFGFFAWRKRSSGDLGDLGRFSRGEEGSNQVSIAFNQVCILNIKLSLFFILIEICWLM